MDTHRPATRHGHGEPLQGGKCVPQRESESEQVFNHSFVIEHLTFCSCLTPYITFERDSLLMAPAACETSWGYLHQAKDQGESATTSRKILQLTPLIQRHMSQHTIILKDKRSKK